MNTIITATMALALAGTEAGENIDLSLSNPTLNPATAPAATVNNLPPVDGALTWTWKNGLRFASADGDVKGKFGGRLQWDTSFLSLDDGLEGAGFDDGDGTEFRRARIFLELELFGNTKMKAQYDLAGPDVDFKDVYIQRKDVLGSVDAKFGHFKEPFSLNELTSSKYITFGERGLPNAMAPGRNGGIQLSDKLTDDFNWAVGVFKETDDGAVNMSDGGFAVTARIAGTPMYDNDGESLVHVGLAFSSRDDSSVSYKTEPEIHLSDDLIDTGAIAAESVDLTALEIATVQGPFHAAAEYIMSDVDGVAGDFEGSGYYLEAGYFLTGESRPYKRSSNAFDRVIPNANSGENGCGAWEIAGRLSSIDMTDGAIIGGEGQNVSVGVNWYLNPNMRFGVNFITGDVDLGGALDSEDVSAILTRFQIDW